MYYVLTLCTLTVGVVSVREVNYYKVYCNTPIKITKDNSIGFQRYRNLTRLDHVAASRRLGESERGKPDSRPH